MIEILSYIAFLLWCLFFINFLINLTVVPEISKINISEPEEYPFLSIVVPARNEEDNIERAVSSFCSQNYPDFEVIVVNDCSTDQTGEILNRLESRFENLRVLNGKEPEKGWLGKPNTLEIGKRKAKGEWCLFVDADVVYHPDLLKNAMAIALKKRADMLVLLPEFVSRGIIEPAVLSVIAFFALISPMYLIPRTRTPYHTAGNGVFNLVKRKALEESGAFGSIKDAIVDDMALGYTVKKAGFKINTAFATDFIKIRMYEGAAETVNGFMKNSFPLAVEYPIGVGLIAGIGSLIAFTPYIHVISGALTGEIAIPGILSILISFCIYGGITVKFNQRWFNIFLFPFSAFLWLWIPFKSFLIYRKEGLIWRGRHYSDR